jgi:hypothetical protein
MGFEPLETDERIAGGAKPKSMDDMMLFGCTGFVLASIFSYFLGVWPHFVMQDIAQATVLGANLALGFLPSAILGGFASVRYGLPGACGYVSGSMAIAVFLFLRLEAIFLGAETKQTHAPEYGRFVLYLLPVTWVLVATVIGVGLLRLHRTSPQES